MSEKSCSPNTALSKTVVTTRATLADSTHPRRRIGENFLVIWMDTCIDQSKQGCRTILEQLASVVNDVKIFTQPDECMDFLTDIEDMKVFLIIEGALSHRILPLIHDIAQLDTIYTFCDNKCEYEEWRNKEWVKVKGVYTTIIPICEELHLAIKQYIQDTIAMSFLAMNEGVANKNLNQLEPSFMYSQIFKEILLEMEYNEQSIKNFSQFWRDHYITNNSKLTVIAEFERDYSPQSSIWWYTREYFVYHMLNQALRTLEADTIINMGFFVHHLHHQIVQLHQQQIGDYHGQPFTVYRGQGLSTADFEKLLKTKGGLISFNNFLSTSKHEAISLIFANSALAKTGTVGVLFKMFVDPSITSTAFASIRDVSYFPKEEEILFSMQAIFRIGQITKIDEGSPLYRVELTLTSDDDQQLRTLIQYIQEETADSTGWRRLGQLLIKLNQFDKAEELSKALLEQISDETSEKALYYNQLGYIKDEQGDYELALWYHEKALEIDQKFYSPNHRLLAISYNNIALVHRNIGAYSKALSFFEKALEIFEKIFPANDSSLAITYNNIGSVYHELREHSNALSFCEKALKIFENILPSNHPSLATSYNNVASLHRKMGEYWKALSFFQKALDIQQKTLLSNHPDLATSYNNIALLYRNMKQYSQSLSFLEKALNIHLKIFPANHPILATSYNNIGWVFKSMGNYSKALSYLKRALDIRQQSLPPNHPGIQDVRENIEIVKRDLCIISDKEKKLFLSVMKIQWARLTTTGTYIHMYVHCRSTRICLLLCISHHEKCRGKAF